MLPVFFVAMAVPLWKGRRDTIAWTVAGIVSVTTWWLVPGYLFIVAGALAGAITGAILRDARRWVMPSSPSRPATFAAILGMAGRDLSVPHARRVADGARAANKPVRDGLAALPGSIVIAVVLPLAVKAGPTGVLAWPSRSA